MTKHHLRRLRWCGRSRGVRPWPCPCRLIHQWQLGLFCFDQSESRWGLGGMDCPRGLVAPGRSAGAYRSQRGLGKAWREPWRFSQKDTIGHQHHYIGLVAKHAWIEYFPQCWHEVCGAYFKGLMLTKYVNVSWHFLLQRLPPLNLFIVAASFFYRFNKYF